MVRLALCIKAELEDVTGFEPAAEDYDWHFKVKCNSCHETHSKIVTVNRKEERDLATGRDTANFVWKCSNCGRASSAKFEKFDSKTPPVKPYNIESSEKQEFAPIAALECRGLEFTTFYPQGTWKCVGVDSGTKFPDVVLDEGEWTDYDEKAAKPVSIGSIESKWQRI